MACLSLPIRSSFTKPTNYLDLPYKSWMSYFQEDLLADIPVIPGSHDSGTLAVLSDEGWLGVTGWLYAQTQDTTITKQLELGVRMLDIRLYVTEDVFDEANSIYVSHTYRSSITFAQALSEIAVFLKANPTEFIYLLLRIDEAHILQEHTDTKKAYIESVMLQSQVKWAGIDSDAIKTAKVKDVIGKVVLIAKSTVLPTDSSITHIVYDNEYSVCDIFEYSSRYAAKQRISTCMALTTPSMSKTGIVYGFALDGQFDQLWPNITSREMNDWFFYNFQSNPTWITRKDASSLGVLLLDFVSIDYTSVLIDYNIQIATSGFKAYTHNLGRTSISILITFILTLQIMYL